MQSKQKLLLNRAHKAQVTRGGYWYFVFALLIGAAALYSNNNIIYLVESVMLGGVLFSGMISECFLRGLSLKRSLNQAVALQCCGDEFFLKNEGLFPVFLIEVGEWQHGNFVAHGMAISLWPGKSVHIKSNFIYPTRGTVNYQCIGVSTSFPFGLVRRFRNTGLNGNRIVWPNSHLDLSSSQKILFSPKGFLECIEGELDEINYNEDVSKAHWPSCIRLGRLVKMKHALVEETTILKLDVRVPNTNIEEAITGNAKILRNSKNSVTLFIVNDHGIRRYNSMASSMNALALLPRVEV